MDRSRLARELVQAALAFHERALWLALDNEDMFALRLPGHDHPLLASVLGAGGQEFGLYLYRGPSALANARAMLANRDPRDISAQQDFLFVTFDSPGRIPDECSAVLREARFSGRVAPWFVAKEAGKRARRTRHAEHELLLRVLRGVLAAADASLLRPLALPPSGPAVVWTITLADESPRPLRAKFEPFGAESAVPALGPVLLPADLRHLPPTDAHWLVSAPMLPGCLAGDERILHAALVVDAGGGQVLKLTAMLGIDVELVARELFDACRGRNARDAIGLPARIDFDQPEVHAALAPALAELAIPARCVDSLPLVHRIVDAFSANILGAAPAISPLETIPAPDDLEGWKRLDEHATMEIVRLAGDSGLGTHAARRYFGPEPELHQDDHEAAAQCLVDWVVFSHRSGHKPTVAERALAQPSLPPGLRAVLTARAESPPGVFRVSAIVRGESLDLTDLLSGRVVRVHDRLLSETAREDMVFFARVYPAGAYWFVTPLSAVLPTDSEEALQWLEGEGIELTPAGLARGELGRLWTWCSRRRQAPIQLTNTDGEPLRDIRASFGVADPAALRAALQRDDVEDDGDELVWVRRAGEQATCLARLQIIGDELVATVNSEGRLERLRQWLLALPGVYPRDVTRQRFAAPTGDDRPPTAGPPAPVPPETLQAVREAVQGSCLAWLDQPIPALGGKTPRQAAGTPEGRRRVARMIRAMPDPQGPNGRIRGAVPRDAMLRELGLEQDGSAG